MITIILTAAFKIFKCHVTNYVQSKCTENLILRPKTITTASAENRIDNSLEIAHTASMQWNYFQSKSNTCANQVVNETKIKSNCVFPECTGIVVQCSLFSVQSPVCFFNTILVGFRFKCLTKNVNEQMEKESTIDSIES